MKKELRFEIYQKYNGHCAYCGKEIRYKDMQVDHIFPKTGGGTDDFENLNPSCRRCNHYKRSLPLEEFRDWRMRDIHKRIMQNYIVKVGIDYGIVKIKPFDGLFYFEKL